MVRVLAIGPHGDVGQLGVVIQLVPQAEHRHVAKKQASANAMAQRRAPPISFSFCKTHV